VKLVQFSKLWLRMVAMIACSTSLFGQNFTWKQTSAPQNLWISVAASADGTKLVAVGSYGGGNIYLSTNSGVTWALSGAQGSAVASSSDGTKLAAAASPGGIITSTNSGTTWTPTSAPNAFWCSIASSSNGVKLVAGLDSDTTTGGIYTSADSGNTWTKTSAPARTSYPVTWWNSVASSSDGTKLAAVEYNTPAIYTSADSGGTWTQTSASTTIQWKYVTSSSDGTKLVAVGGNAIYTSTNSGGSWTPSIGGSSVASSSDGTKLVAVGSGIYTSTNSGTTWTQQTNAPNAAWNAVASSSDGTKIVAVISGGNGGGIWIGQFQPQIHQQPQNVLSCPGDSSIFSVTASGSLPLIYQWRKNGTNLVDGGNVMGSATTNLTLLNLSQSDAANYSVVITNAVGSVTSSVAVLNVNMRPALASPIVVSGFIVGATLTDGGCGYTNPPAIVFSGLGGTGATAYAQISNGSVTNIVITSTGSGYPANAIALFAPPLYPVLSIVQTLTNTPSAAASPVVTNGFIVGAILTASGSGYPTNPAVSFSDASGHGAAAYSQISKGAVTNIVITSTGSGYSSNAGISIAATPTISVVIPSASNLLLGQNYQMQIANGLTGWTGFGAAFSATNPAWTPTNFWNVANTNQMFFRLQMLQ